MFGVLKQLVNSQADRLGINGGIRSKNWSGGRHIPRYSTIVCLVVRSKLGTRDRLVKFGLVSNSIYVLCNSFD